MKLWRLHELFGGTETLVYMVYAPTEADARQTVADLRVNLLDSGDWLNNELVEAEEIQVPNHPKAVEVFVLPY